MFGTMHVTTHTRIQIVKYPRYEYLTESELHFFEFTSVGIRGNVKKIVQYSKLSIDNFYNLAFGDYDETTDQIIRDFWLQENKDISL